MSDQRLRELERRWRETGSVEDEAAYLLERVRTGSLDREMLELAAYCGHPASNRCLGVEGAHNHDETLLGWVSGLARWGRDTLVWVAWKVAEEWRGESVLGRDDYQRFLDIAYAARQREPTKMADASRAFEELRAMRLGRIDPLVHAVWLAGEREPDTESLDLSIAFASESLNPDALLVSLRRSLANLALAESP
jgi:hypothetical protein